MVCQQQSITIRSHWVTESNGNSLHCLGAHDTHCQLLTKRHLYPHGAFLFGNLCCLGEVLYPCCGVTPFVYVYVHVLGSFYSSRSSDGFSRCLQCWVVHPRASFSTWSSTPIFYLTLIIPLFSFSLHIFLMREVFVFYARQNTNNWNPKLVELHLFPLQKILTVQWLNYVGVKLWTVSYQRD